MYNPWEIYDRLIGQIPDNWYLDSIVRGDVWTAAGCKDAVGCAMTLHSCAKSPTADMDFCGQPLKQAAARVKSWDFFEASAGAAALNAYYCKMTKDRAFDGCRIWENENAFEAYKEQTRGKKVALIGHFRSLERYLTYAAEVTVLERVPEEGDLPDSACEYILPQQDYVFMTGSTIVNKTLPRLLQLCEKPYLVITGPSTVLSPILFEYGVDELSGFIPNDMSALQRSNVLSDNKGVFKNGVKVRLQKI